MSDEERNDSRNLLDKLIALLSGLPWLEVLQGLWKAIRKLIQARSYRGMYEVLDYKSALELKRWGGKRATFKSGGMERSSSTTAPHPAPVDRYRSGYKTHIVQSRQAGTAIVIIM